jgi:hypothetical protein
MRPGPEGTALGDYLNWLATERGRTFPNYASLWRWSIETLDGFWTSVWDRFGGHGNHEEVLGNRDMPGAEWFPQKLETPIKQILLGRAADEVISRDSVSDFTAITVFESVAADLRRVGAR